MLPQSRSWNVVVQRVLVWLVAVTIPSRTLAQVRPYDPEETINTYFNTRGTVQLAADLGPGGIHGIAGGVVFHGRVRFILQNGDSRTVVPDTALTLMLNSEGLVFLSYHGTQYRVEIHRGLACPLGRFIRRGGSVAFTIPRATSQSAIAQVQGAGLVRIGRFNVFIAREFIETPFSRLLSRADFARTDTLPSSVRSRIMSSLNATIGLPRTSVLEGSYFNTDYQVTYQAYMMFGEGRTEIAGVPLRYYWNYAGDGSAVVYDVEVLSQDWPSNSTVTDLSVQENRPSQYDIISLFQAAAVFRQMQAANPVRFARFVTAACSI